MVLTGDNQLEDGYYGQLMVVPVIIMMKSANESVVGGWMIVTPIIGIMTLVVIVQQLVQGFHIPLWGLSLIPYYNFYGIKNVRVKLRPKINISVIQLDSLYIQYQALTNFTFTISYISKLNLSRWVVVQRDKQKGGFGGGGGTFFL